MKTPPPARLLSLSCALGMLLVAACHTAEPSIQTDQVRDWKSLHAVEIDKVLFPYDEWKSCSQFDLNRARLMEADFTERVRAGFLDASQKFGIRGVTADAARVTATLVDVRPTDETVVVRYDIAGHGSMTLSGTFQMHEWTEHLGKTLYEVSTAAAQHAGERAGR